MNKFSIILIFLSSLYFSQTKQFVYEYKYVPDSQKKDLILTDYMQLDTDGNRSDYYSQSLKKTDSLINIIEKLNRFDFPRYNPNLNYRISKDYLLNEVAVHIKYGNINFKIEEKDKPKWKIINEKKTVSNYKCQKATVKYLGREWTAWFTNEIPLQDGPYKFNGLPGLVIQINDSENEHSFELIEIKNISKVKPNTTLQEKTISWNQYYKLMAETAQNVNNNIDKMVVLPNGYSFVLKDGNVMHVDKSKKNIEEALSDEIMLINNPIERDKLKIYNQSVK
ncbi:GLPGLI family protein [Kaistella flava (ex Peng et al. 2021)]|uniref:GLPGLI family protein n=1 Tax=Kaistella flava (ex Peng et al. 2021) TaxID=2038776 RepID=A0A7M2Y850_9FLAO|nr:GLPGLI family protein [Kaistella flava (ex Peng et al. 2021)]QOW09844.1 GLPGLI family protein [Kaistella flava (ex Peng et al. 2021)]